MNKEDNCNVTNEYKMPVWILNYDIKNIGKGTAVVKADNPNRAVNILRADGIYNGTPKVYQVESIQQFIESPEEMLISEQNLNI